MKGAGAVSLSESLKWLQLRMARGILLVIVAAALALSFMASSAFAATTVEVAPQKDDAYKEIQRGLNEARDHATTKNPYVVKVAPGTYTIGKRLLIYSNTTLDLEGVTLRSDPLKSGNMLRLGDASDKNPGYFHKNIAILGGVFDHAKHANTCIKLAHGKNITLKNVEVRNTKNGHLVEVAGVNGFTAENCTFRDQIQTTGGAGIPEAIQIDVLIEKHMPGCLAEDLPSKNITIEGCSFINVPRGVGSHTAIINQYVKNVTIVNNTFTQLRSEAIRTMNFYNCRIEGNTIANAPRGIAVFGGHRKGMFLASTPSKEGGIPTTTPCSYKSPPKNSKIVIRNNSIKTAGKDCYTPSEPNDGIYLCGLSFGKRQKKTKDSDAIPAGNYYVSGVVIEGNTIKTTGNGIRISDARNVEVRKNAITYTGSRSDPILSYGVYVREGSKKIEIAVNRINSTRSHGVVVTSSSQVTAVTGNSVSKAGRIGISLQGAKVDTITKNKVSSSGAAGISIASGSSVKLVYKNEITSSKSHGIVAESRCKVEKVSSNAIKSVKGSGVYVCGDASVLSLKNSRIASPKRYGILCSGGKIDSIKGNRIQSPKASGIMVKSKAKVKKITSNSVKSGKSHGVAIRGNGIALAIKGNTVSQCKKVAIYINLQDRHKIKVSANKLKGKRLLTAVCVESGVVSVSGSRRVR